MGLRVEGWEQFSFFQGFEFRAGRSRSVELGLGIYRALGFAGSAFKLLCFGTPGSTFTLCFIDVVACGPTFKHAGLQPDLPQTSALSL